MGMRMKTAAELGLTEQELAEQVALAEQVIGEIILEERIDLLRKALRTLEGLPEVYTSDRAYNVVKQALDATCDGSPSS